MKKVNLLDIPKIKTIKALANHRLKAGFVGGQTRVYDFRPLLDKYEASYLLKNEAFFKAVNVCPNRQRLFSIIFISFNGCDDIF